MFKLLRFYWMRRSVSLSLALRPKLFELFQKLRLFFEFRQRPQVRSNVRPIKNPSLSHHDVFHVNPILSACSEGLESARIVGNPSGKATKRETPGGRSLGVGR